MNFRVVLVFICLGVGAIALSAFVPHADEFGRQRATDLGEAGKALVIAAISILSPEAIRRVFTGGERATDPKPLQPPEGRAREQ